MEIIISGQEISGACPKCEELRKFLLTLTIARDSAEMKFEIVSASLDCASCGFSASYPHLSEDCISALALLGSALIEMELSLYRLFAEVIRNERRKILDAQT